jgi:DNA-binding NarL/FixJ family response regulator
VAGGANTRAVAAHLYVSPATVRNHVQNILVKLDVHSRLEAAAYAADMACSAQSKNRKRVEPGGAGPFAR